MSNELIKMFKNQEVKVKTDKGETLINLVQTARCCGLVKIKNGKEYIRWTDKGIADKLKLISSTIVELKYKEEVQFVLNEIENSDDRNSIYMSSWLSRRLAMECSNNKSMEYKNFLATLDEQIDKGELVQQQNTVQIANMVSQVVNQIIPTLTEQIAVQVIPVVNEVRNQVNTMAGLMHDQSEIYDVEREELKSLIGFRSINTTKLTRFIKEKLSDKLGIDIKASSPQYIKIRENIFKEFDVIKFEDIPANIYNKVYAFTDTLIDDTVIN